MTGKKININSLLVISQGIRDFRSTFYLITIPSIPEAFTKTVTGKGSGVYTGDMNLKDDKDFKRDFVSEGLKYLQIKKCEKDCPKEVSDAIDRVNENFSQEVINLYSPQYGEKLLADFEKNNPND